MEAYMRMAKLGAYGGMTIGILGWMIGFTVFCLGHGYTELAARVLPLGLLLSLALAALAIIVLECMLRIYGPQHYMLMVALWGLLLMLMGVLILLANHWLAPLIEATPGAAVELGKMGSVYRTGDNVPLWLLAGGLLGISFVAARLLTDKHSEPAES